MTNDPLEPLRREYLQLVGHDLPQAARAASTPWPIRFNHCFMRVVLDNVLSRCWYEVLDRRRPAYRQLTAEQLQAGVKLARQMLADPTTINGLNRRSLQFRGKA